MLVYSKLVVLSLLINIFDSRPLGNGIDGLFIWMASNASFSFAEVSKVSVVTYLCSHSGIVPLTKISSVRG